MFRTMFLIGVAALVALPMAPVEASDRYGQKPPVVVSPDLTAPWVMQLGRQPGRVVQRDAGYAVRVQPAHRTRQREQRRVKREWQQPDTTVRTAAVPAPRRKQVQPQMDPMFLPREVDYSGSERPGTIVIDSTSKFLYLVRPGGKARRYGVGVGQEGMAWTGTQTITSKRVWPDWRPPAQMIARERAKGRVLPAHMEGGPANPLGARALYLGSTLYRIHGTNAPWTIGTNVSSGCIRMRNEDVVDLYERVDVGTRVVVM